MSDSWPQFKLMFDVLNERLGRVEEKLDLIIRHLGAGAAGSGPLAPSDLVKGLVRTGNTLQAIKAYREQTGVTLAEAEMVVNAIATNAPRE